MRISLRGMRCILYIDLISHEWIKHVSFLSSLFHLVQSIIQFLEVIPDILPIWLVLRRLKLNNNFIDRSVGHLLLRRIVELDRISLLYPIVQSNLISVSAVALIRNWATHRGFE